ncbi:MAG TPA: YjbQ family protein [Thermoanaerobaculia bacterium]|nr:YjbQ family protein [Thermoanaerobaculia bacterium]
MGTSRLIPMEKGKPKLGRWQGIFLIELDGPRERTVEVTALASLSS